MASAAASDGVELRPSLAFVGTVRMGRACWIGEHSGRLPSIVSLRDRHLRMMLQRDEQILTAPVGAFVVGLGSTAAIIATKSVQYATNVQDGATVRIFRSTHGARLLSAAPIVRSDSRYLANFSSEFADPVTHLVAPPLGGIALAEFVIGPLCPAHQQTAR